MQRALPVTGTALIPPAGGGQFTALHYDGATLYMGGDVSGVMSYVPSTGAYANLSQGLGSLEIDGLATSPAGSSSPTYLYAATTAGIYRRDLTATGATFEHLELPGTAEEDLFFTSCATTATTSALYKKFCRGLFRAADAAELSRKYAVQSIAVSPWNADEVWAGLGSGYLPKDPPGGYRNNAFWVLFRSQDAGNTWRGVLSLHLDPAVDASSASATKIGPTVWDIAIESSSAGNRVFVATDMGLYVTTNPRDKVQDVVWNEVGQSGGANTLTASLLPIGSGSLSYLWSPSKSHTTCPGTGSGKLPISCTAGATDVQAVHPDVRAVGISNSGGVTYLTVSIADDHPCADESATCTLNNGVYQSTYPSTGWSAISGLETAHPYDPDESGPISIRWGATIYSGLAVNPSNPNGIAVTTYRRNLLGWDSLAVYKPGLGWIGTPSNKMDLRLETGNGVGTWDACSTTAASWKVVAKDWSRPTLFHSNSVTVEMTRGQYLTGMFAPKKFELLHPFEDTIDSTTSTPITYSPSSSSSFWTDTRSTNAFHQTLGPSTLTCTTRLLAVGSAHMIGCSDSGLLITEDLGVSWAKMYWIAPTTFPISEAYYVNDLAVGSATAFAAVSGAYTTPGRLLWAATSAPKAWSDTGITDAVAVDVLSSGGTDTAYVARASGLYSVTASGTPSVLCSSGSAVSRVAVATTSSGSKLVWFIGAVSGANKIQRYDPSTGSCEILGDAPAHGVSMLRAAGTQVFIGALAGSAYARLYHAAADVAAGTALIADTLTKSSAYTSRTHSVGDTITYRAEYELAPHDIILSGSTLFLTINDFNFDREYTQPANILSATYSSTSTSAYSFAAYTVTSTPAPQISAGLLSELADGRIYMSHTAGFESFTP